MDFNEYAMTRLVHERLAEAREASARRALVASLTPRRRPLRVRAGEALIALGRRLTAVPAPQRVTP